MRCIEIVDHRWMPSPTVSEVSLSVFCRGALVQPPHRHGATRIVVKVEDVVAESLQKRDDFTSLRRIIPDHRSTHVFLEAIVDEIDAPVPQALVRLNQREHTPKVTIRQEPHQEGFFGLRLSLLFGYLSTKLDILSLSEYMCCICQHGHDSSTMSTVSYYLIRGRRTLAIFGSNDKEARGQSQSLPGAHFFFSLPVYHSTTGRRKMPRRQTPDEQDVSEQLSSHRSNLAMYRCVLIQFLDKLQLDRVELDNRRCIFRSKTVSSKRLTFPMINGIVEECVRVVKEAPGHPPQEIDVVGFLKLEMKSRCDVVSFKGNVIDATSADAKRVTREGTLLRRGGPELVDDETRQICDAMWEEMGQRRQLLEESKAVKRRGMEHPEMTRQCPTGRTNRTLAGAEATSPTSSRPPLVNNAPKDPAKPVTAPRPQSSISKKQASTLFSTVAAYIAAHHHDEGLREAVLQIVQRGWPHI